MSSQKTRIQAYAPDLQSIQSQAKVLPVWIPSELEAELGDALQSMTNASPTVKDLSNHLVAMPDLSLPPATVQDLAVLSNNTPWPNLKFWRINGSNMWAGQHYVLDETFEILRSCYRWFRVGKSDDASGVLHFARAYRERVMLPAIPDVYEHQSTQLLSKLPSLRESMLFLPWVTQYPLTVTSRDTAAVEEYWCHGDEGYWDLPGIPLWHPSPREQMSGQATRTSGVAWGTAETSNAPEDVVPQEIIV